LAVFVRLLSLPDLLVLLFVDSGCLVLGVDLSAGQLRLRALHLFASIGGARRYRERDERRPEAESYELHGRSLIDGVDGWVALAPQIAIDRAEDVPTSIGRAFPGRRSECVVCDAAPCLTWGVVEGREVFGC